MAVSSNYHTVVKGFVGYIADAADKGVVGPYPSMNIAEREAIASVRRFHDHCERYGFDKECFKDVLPAHLKLTGPNVENSLGWDLNQRRLDASRVLDGYCMARDAVLVRDPDTSKEVLDELSRRPGANGVGLQFQIAMNPKSPPEVLDRLAMEGSAALRPAVLANPNTSLKAMAAVACREHKTTPEVSKAIAERVKGMSPAERKAYDAELETAAKRLPRSGVMVFGNDKEAVIRGGTLSIRTAPFMGVSTIPPVKGHDRGGR